MDLELLTNRHFRLRQALSVEYRARPWVSIRIDRIADAMAATERAIAQLQPPAHGPETGLSNTGDGGNG